jgi:competence ComEA-like helix-hairpin-helix protein
LFSFLLLIIAANFILPFLIKDEPVNFTSFEARVYAFEQKQKRIADSIQKQRDEYLDTKNPNDLSRLNPFPFDPNQLPEEKWKALGLSDYQVKMIKKYEAKGGRFNTASDLAKIYSISENEFMELEPYIKIATKNAHLNIEDNTVEIHPEPFDPNTATIDDFVKMGLPQNLAFSIVNYREKGGVYRTKSDLKKIYNLPGDIFSLLELYIQLPEHISPIDEPEQFSIQIEINTADTLDLQQIPGIGPSFARRIVKYRNMLGGFYKIEQLLEVYGMDSARYAGIYDKLLVDPSHIKQINVNTASIKELMVHPYIEFYLAKSILTFREEAGTFTNTGELKNIRLMYDELFYKIQPYLKINEPTAKK